MGRQLSPWPRLEELRNTSIPLLVCTLRSTLSASTGSLIHSTATRHSGSGAGCASLEAAASFLDSSSATVSSSYEGSKSEARLYAIAEISF